MSLIPLRTTNSTTTTATTSGSPSGPDRFRRVFEIAPVAIGICNDGGRIVAVNAQYTRAFGYTRDDAPTLTEALRLFFPDPGYRADIASAWYAAEEVHVRTGTAARPVVARVRCKDGSDRIIEMRSAHARNGELVVIFDDITAEVSAEQERKRAEAASESAMQQLQLQASRMPLALLLTDATPDLIIRQWNPGAERMFGHAASEVLGKSSFGVTIPLEQREAFAPIIANRANTQDTVRALLQHTTKDGRTIWCEWFNTPLFDATGRLTGMMSMAEEVTERVQTEERMKLWSSVLEHSSEAIVICDERLRILMVNHAFETTTGYSEQEAVGQTPRILQSGRHDATFYAAMWKTIAETGGWQGELWNRRKNGECYPEWLSINAVRSDAGAITHYVGIATDITARKASEQRIRHLAQYDGLTDLPNRTLCAERLEQLIELAAREQGRVAALFIDLDHFKEVNDSLGHDAGDLLLVGMARRLRDGVREADTVARMGGDEFVVLLPKLRTPEDAAVLAQKLLGVMNEPIMIGSSELVISGSVGICVYPDDGTNAGQLIRNADAAMYEAKNAGRNAYRFYTHDMNSRALERLSLENALRRAIAREEFVLHYQPKVDIASGKLAGVEALLRWQRPGVGLVPPGQFIPLAEERGLIVQMGKWALEEAARQAARWARDGMPLCIAVNLSALQFHQKGFVEHVEAVLATNELAPELLELELTESIIIKDTQATITLLERLHAIGVPLSIDDFGTGYSSLNYLRRFPIERVKIDKSFIDEIPEHAETTRVVSGIIALAAALGLRVVAEGVETAAQLEILRASGCNEAQGYYFSRPVPAEALEALVRAWPGR